MPRGPLGEYLKKLASNSRGCSSIRAKYFSSSGSSPIQVYAGATTTAWGCANCANACCWTEASTSAMGSFLDRARPCGASVAHPYTAVPDVVAVKVVHFDVEDTGLESRIAAVQDVSVENV